MPKLLATCPSVVALTLLLTATCAGAAEVKSQSIDIGGRSLTMLRQGEGGIPIVIEAGGGHPAADSDEWKPVCDELSKTNLIIRYSRAGLGSSDAPPTTPVTVVDGAADLHELLDAAEVPRPFILVGHSLGGLYARAYVEAHPDDVAGFVMVDIAHPDQDSEWLKTLPAETAGEDPALPPIRQFLTRRVNNRGDNPDHLDFITSRKQIAEFRHLGDLPLAVLTHSPNWKMVPNLSDEYLEPIEATSQRLQKTLPQLSNNSTHTIAAKAGHGIHIDEPELVVAAVREVLEKVEAKRNGGAKN